MNSVLCFEDTLDGIEVKGVDNNGKERNTEKSALKKKFSDLLTLIEVNIDDGEKLIEMVKNLPFKGTLEITIRDMVYLFKEGVLNPYTNNRGNGKLSMKAVKSIRDDFVPWYLGMLMFGMKCGEFQMVDANSRIWATLSKIKKMQDDGEEIPFLDESVVLKSVSDGTNEDFQKAYAYLNKQQGHSTNNAITCKDMAFGGIINNLVKDFSPEHRKFLKEGSYNQIAYVIYCMSKGVKSKIYNSIDFNYDKIFSSRKEVVNVARSLNKLIVSDDDLSKIRKGLVSYCEYRRILQDKIDVIKKICPKLANKKLSSSEMGCASWLGFYLTEYVRPSGIRKFQNPQAMADAVYDNSEVYKSRAVSINGSSAEYRCEVIKEVKKRILGVKSTRAYV